MSYGWSPGFETCQSCKDEYAKTMDLRLATYMEKYKPLNKKRRTFRTPLLLTAELSRRRLLIFMKKSIDFALSKLKSWPSFQKIGCFNWFEFAAFHKTIQSFTANPQSFGSGLCAQYFVFHCWYLLCVVVKANALSLSLIVHNLLMPDKSYNGVDSTSYSMVS
jgi:hypothetical protein